MPRDRLWNVARIDLYPPLRLWMNNGQMLSSTAHPHYPWCLLSLHLAVIDLFSVCATMKIGKKDVNMNILNNANAINFKEEMWEDQFEK